MPSASTSSSRHALHAGVLLCAGCNLILTDWKVTPDSPSGGAGGTAATTAGGGGAGGAATPATPLEMTPLGADVLTDGVAVHRDGYFRIEADPLSNWQWARWFYLPADPEGMNPLGPVIYAGTNTPYYRTTCLWSAVRGRDPSATGYSMRSCNYTHRNDESPFVGEPALDDAALPVWFSLFGEVDAVWNAEVTFDTRVFASGRVWTHTRMVNNEPSLDEVEIGFGHIALEADDFFLPVPDEEGLFEMKMGGGALLAIDPGSPPDAQWVSETTGLRNDGVMGIWEVLQPMRLGSVHEYTFAFCLGAAVTLASERIDRASDLQSPGLDLDLLQGATTMFASTGGFDPRTGTYTLQKSAGSTAIEAAVDGSRTRFEPAFEIVGWHSPTWTIRLGDELLGTSAGAGPEILATQAADRLSFQYLGAIAGGASQAARTFTITED